MKRSLVPGHFITGFFISSISLAVQFISGIEMSLVLKSKNLRKMDGRTTSKVIFYHHHQMNLFCICIEIILCINNTTIGSGSNGEAPSKSKGMDEMTSGDGVSVCDGGSRSILIVIFREAFEFNVPESALCGNESSMGGMERTSGCSSVQEVFKRATVSQGKEGRQANL